ncbi:MAG: Jag N-terminal domain-containing protein, partial [Eubacteriales bacterium]|nr:Jag N-terminal domain-containing protein [Eubacteriales bacterium]
MQRFIETTGETRDAAIEAALVQLGMDRDDVSVEVLDNGKKGFLGFGATPARVRVTYEVPDE